MNSIPCKIEELPVLGSFLITSVTSDMETFTTYSPVYGNDYITGLQADLEKVNNIVKPVVLTNQMKEATDKLHKAEDSVVEHVAQLEGYALKVAKSTTLKVSGLNLSLLRRKCQSRDAEGVLNGIKIVKQVLAPHLAKFEEVGYTKAKQDELDALFTAIDEANNQQNSMLNQRAKTVSENEELLVGFWNRLQEILKDGKIIFRKNSLKKKEYTLANLKSRVRAAAKQQGEENK